MLEFSVKSKTNQFSSVKRSLYLLEKFIHLNPEFFVNFLFAFAGFLNICNTLARLEHSYKI